MVVLDALWLYSTTEIGVLHKINWIFRQSMSQTSEISPPQPKGISSTDQHHLDAKNIHRQIGPPLLF